MNENPLMQSQEFAAGSAIGQPRSKIVEQANQQHHQDKMTHNQILQESVNQQKIENIKKKQEQNIAMQLQEIRRMINTPTFLPNYFQSKEGQTFTKVFISIINII